MTTAITVVTAAIFTLIGFIAGILIAGKSRAEVETRIIELETMVTGLKIQYKTLKDINENLVKRHHILQHALRQHQDPNDPNQQPITDNQ